MFQELNEKAIKGLTIVVILLCVSYLILFYKTRFWNNTFIGTVDCSYCTVDEAVEKVKQGTKAIKCNFYFDNDIVEHPTYDEIGLVLEPKDFKELLKKPKYKKEWKSHHKLSNDPRITKVGKILRKSSLDEFPQFINVLKGDLSIIGPRPLVEGELDEHNGNHEIYESVKPGITGWWAANGRSAIDYKNRLKLEYYYAKNCNIILDIKCILLTILIVLQRTGAK